MKRFNLFVRSWKGRLRAPLIGFAALLFAAFWLLGCSASEKPQPQTPIVVTVPGASGSGPVEVRPSGPILTDRDRQDIQTLETLNKKYDAMMK